MLTNRILEKELAIGGTPSSSSSSSSSSSNTCSIKPDSVHRSYAILMKQCEALLERLMARSVKDRLHKSDMSGNTRITLVISKSIILKEKTSCTVKHPMDLGTVRKKLAADCYCSQWGFVSDVRLTFANAMRYITRQGTACMTWHRERASTSPTEEEIGEPTTVISFL
ncbi:hypothetical protein GW17_00013108 [Ensete ventricosum]|uniref:Uncharacterized protein n=1 Tax=Ensete ventricosum TaxID=4639 RepID=A0A444FJ79_ENSVE|nr:hypothetical protein GW17_00013108 [Ensete ventricosum]RZR70603.1 hypothetical protein BHM03_00000697 [Ensete ventricosum]